MSAARQQQHSPSLTSSQRKGTANGSAEGVLSEADITINDTIENSGDGEHAIEADGEKTACANTAVNKTGSADGDFGAKTEDAVKAAIDDYRAKQKKSE